MMKITDKLVELSNQELEIVNLIQSIKGSLEERRELLIKQNVFEKYRKIFYEYSKIEDIEAIKRAVFIQWYATIEPDVFSGIGELDKEEEDKNLEKIYGMVFNSTLDAEFTYMLSHYYQLSEWLFNNDVMNIFSEKRITDVLFEGSSKMVNRGQMGVYWNSVVFGSVS